MGSRRWEEIGQDVLCFHRRWAFPSHIFGREEEHGDNARGQE